MNKYGNVIKRPVKIPATVASLLLSICKYFLFRYNVRRVRSWE